MFYLSIYNVYNFYLYLYYILLLLIIYYYIVYITTVYYILLLYNILLLYIIIIYYTSVYILYTITATIISLSPPAYEETEEQRHLVICLRSHSL